MPNTDIIWKDSTEIDHLLDDIATRLRLLLKERNIQNYSIIGIHSGGVWLAQVLSKLLGQASTPGELDISFYRDDFTRIGMHPQVKPSRIETPVDNQHIILVDDILQTGRTIRAALNTIFDYGRPASIMLVTLVTLNHRELPIAADVSGCELTLPTTQRLKLSGPEPLLLHLVNVSHPDAVSKATV